MSERKQVNGFGVKIWHQRDLHMGKIRAIAGFLDNTQKKYRFRLNGQNCVIIGKNGAGKTSLLKDLHSRLTEQLHQSGAVQQMQMRENFKSYFNQISQNPQSEEALKKVIKDTRERAKSGYRILPCIVSIHDAKKLSEEIKNNKGVLRLFTAHRQSEIKEVKSAEPFIKTKTHWFQDHKYGQEFEQHLVNMQVRLALGTDQKNTLESEIKDWFDHFNENLQYLFEDNTVHAVFNRDELRFYIHQQGKHPFTFQNLSSGYAAIFEIYSDLFVRAEYHRVIPSTLTGVVLIDEIDTHLHISLQRKILPFFYKSFPHIQFIVTTHSPFVITSTDDSIIFDISSNEVSRNLSMYSLESIVEGLLGVPAISKSLEDKINLLIEYTSQKQISPEAENLVREISPFRDSMDSESQMHLEIAINKILKFKRDNI
jgi:predicted ATP-binding protein involved in virulence